MERYKKKKKETDVLKTYYLAGYILYIFISYVSFHLKYTTSTKILESAYYYSHFTFEKPCLVR